MYDPDDTHNGTSVPGGLVESVEPDGPAARAGIMPGDRIISLDGHPLRDVIDYQFRVEPVRQEIGLQRDGDLLHVELDNHDSDYPGIIFRNALFDGVMQCRCNCVFCFVDQVPDGLREALYLKDDDYRLSFLYGNFITLNNMKPDDVERIIEQRLSPLYVSVHASDIEVRAGLMGCSRQLAAAGLDNLQRLGNEGIEAHAQIVLCSGINDGAVLEQTVEDLARDYPAVSSIGVVPVAVDESLASENVAGRAAAEPLSVEECRRTAADITIWQERFREVVGYGFVYAADEIYLRAGVPLPDLGAYDDVPQYENGVGITVTFQQNVGEILYRQLRDFVGERVFLLAGTLAGEPVTAALDSLEQTRPAWLKGISLSPLVAENNLFGPHVTVTGLLGGRDVVAAASAAGAGRDDLLLMPSAVLDSSGERFLDDMTLGQLSAELDCTVQVV